MGRHCWLDEVVPRILEGEERAASDWYTALFPQLVAGLSRVTTSRQHREDAVAEALNHLLEARAFRLARWEPTRCIVSYAITCARRRLIRALTREKRSSGISPVDPDEAPFVLSEHGELRISEADLDLAIGRMPPRVREVLRPFRQGYSNQEIADFLGISAWSVSQRKQEGLRLLRRGFGLE